jgi:hypothetical protein
MCVCACKHINIYMVVQKSLDTQSLTHCLYCHMICTTLYTYMLHGVSRISTLSDEVWNMFKEYENLFKKLD